MLIDLHTHSTASDGRLSPACLVEAAAEAGIGMLALTDHDTIDGLDEAAAAADKAGIRFIRGVELEIDWPNIGGMKPREFHLLGLGFGKPSTKFKQVLFELQNKRIKRNKKMLKRLHKMGFDASLEEIRGSDGTAFVGRPHFADFLIRNNVVKDGDEAFKKYLTKGKPLYVPKEGVKLRRALSAIKESGGCTVLAHPTSFHIAWGRMPGVFAYLKSKGLEGIEAYHPNMTLRVSERLLAMAKAEGFYVSAGSDFHGDQRRDRKLGHTAGGIKITPELVDIEVLFRDTL